MPILNLFMHQLKSNLGDYSFNNLWMLTQLQQTSNKVSLNHGIVAIQIT